MSTLSEYLKSSGQRQADFAVAIGVSQGTVSRLAAGEFTPRLHLAKRIERATGGKVKATDLVRDDDHTASPVDDPAPVQPPPEKSSAADATLQGDAA